MFFKTVKNDLPFLIDERSAVDSVEMSWQFIKRSNQLGSHITYLFKKNVDCRCYLQFN